MFVKICGITSEDDALLAVALGADAIGFVFAPSPRQIAPQLAYDIIRRLPAGIMPVGVFRNEHPDRVVEIVHGSRLKAAQLHGTETPAVTRQVRAKVGYVIKAFPAGSDELARADDWGADVVLVDGANPGSGMTYDWGLVDAAPQDAKVLLAGGLTPENVATAIRRVRPWGVDVATGVEREPGRKDPVMLKAFLDAARAAAPVPYRGPDELPYDWQDE
jgi:phosphoribosylanthranilate isomerase